MVVIDKFLYGLIINGNIIRDDDVIIITKIEGISKLSYLFKKKIIDEVIISFQNHKRYNTSMMKMFLKRNGKIISIGERFEMSKKEIESDLNLMRRFPCKPIEINIEFADELEFSNAVIYKNKL